MRIVCLKNCENNPPHPNPAHPKNDDTNDVYNYCPPTKHIHERKHYKKDNNNNGKQIWICRLKLCTLTFSLYVCVSVSKSNVTIQRNAHEIIQKKLILHLQN